MTTMELPLEDKKGMEEDKERTDVDNSENTEVSIENPSVKSDHEESTEGNQDQEQEQAPPHTEEDQDEAPQTTQEKQENVLNLNNEVVKMRKEVKRVRTLIIRKLTRQMGALKKRKGKDADIERNQRRAARLLEEIHAIKTLVPDLVTKTALQKNLNFEQVCKDPKSSISDRALARVATHPQFNKRIEEIKAAVKAFKDERTKGAKLGGKMQKKADKTKKLPPSMNPEKEPVTPTKSEDSKRDTVESCHKGSGISLSDEKKKQNVHQTEVRTANTNNKQNPIKNKSKPQSKGEESKAAGKVLELPPKPKMEAESDIEFSEGDEKEYFDDSTEERFHKQSSGESEESDNDFFVGKVSKFKKKKKTKTIEDKAVQKTIENSSDKPSQTNKVQNELDHLESRMKSKPASLNSVFCPSLAKPKTGKPAAKGDRKCGGQDKYKKGGNKDFSKQTSLPKGFKGKPADSDGGRTFGKGQEKFGGKGPIKEHMRAKDSRGRNPFPPQAPQQALHPSWEASKKRKEQQGQILAFQGKKIKFDDD